VLHLRVFGVSDAMSEVAQQLHGLPGLRHVVHAGNGSDSQTTLVSADVDEEAADSALQVLQALHVPAGDIVLMRVDPVGPELGAHAVRTIVWTDLIGRSRANARPFAARYLVYMAVAGVIAGFGVIYENQILIVGAMAVSPDMLPITATATGLVLRRWRLARRALITLVIGLGFAGLVAGVMTAILNPLDLLPNFEIGNTGFDDLFTVNASTVVVAFVAGVAGILAFETRASAAVGVAISITAAAYLGVAAGIGQLSKAISGLLVLGVNIALITLGGSLTLLLQRHLKAGDA
jgi:uncharacterized hydrophobic protein (TIGR00271 family)